MVEMGSAYEPLLPEVEADGSCESVLVVDVGETNTRASFFCMVEGVFRFVAAASSPTTVYAPYHHPGYGVRNALEQLEKATGQSFIGEDGHILTPRREHDKGVDGFEVIFSAGAALRVVTAGLRAEISLDSLRRLAGSTYAEIVGSMHLGDGLTWEQRGEMLLRLSPDVVLIAGGYEGGARNALNGMLRAVDLVCSCLPKSTQPVVIYAGNAGVQAHVRRALANVNELHLVTNVRPNRESEQMAPLRSMMAQVLRQERSRRFPGFAALDGWANGDSIPFTAAFGRTVRFLSLDDPSRAVLGVDLGTRKAVCAVAYRGEMDLHVVTAPGCGEANLADSQGMREVLRWLTIAASEEEVRDYLSNRALYPASLPVTFRDLAIEQAIARATLRKAAALIARDMPRLVDKTREGTGHGASILSDIEPIFASGSVLSRAPNLAHTALMILDGLQPAGITSLILDQNHLMGAVGAAMKMSPALAVQIMDSNAFVNLGLMIAPSFQVGKGEPVLRLRMLTDSGKDLRMEVNQGELRTLPLNHEQQVQIWLKPLNGADIGLGPGQGGRLGQVSGGALGLIIDCRGRPLGLPRDPDQRRERCKEWLRSLRG